MFGFRDKKLGVADKPRRYDIPLKKSQGLDFLVILIALMTFLVVMSLSTAFILGGITKSWSSGLENKLTVEISALDSTQKIMPADALESLTHSVASVLKANNTVRSYRVMERADIQDLLSPWLGENLELTDIPLPVLISVDLQMSTPDILEPLKTSILKVAPNAKIDTHQGWLQDILRLTGSLKIVAAFITIIIILTTLIAIIGAIRSRMAIHKSDIELLHLMGASDSYISRQFQRYAMILGLQGSAFGVLCGVMLLFIVTLLTRSADAAMIPSIQITITHGALIFSMPVIAALLSAIAARMTVLHQLSLMP